MATATYAEVCTAIDSEREYQNTFVTLDPSRHDAAVDANHTVGNYCTMLQHYVNVMSQTYDDDVLTHLMRKIAGIAVRCIEEYAFRVVHADGVSVTVIHKPMRQQVYDALQEQALVDAYAERDRLAGFYFLNAAVKQPIDYSHELQDLQEKLVEAWTLNPGHDVALALLPHIAYTAMRCMEANGALPRVWQQAAPAAASAASP